MDLGKILAHLHAELADLDAAIATIKRLQQADRERRASPELWPRGPRITRRRVRKVLAQTQGGESVPVKKSPSPV